MGILGVGSIASSIVIGLCEGVMEPPQLVLSPRSQARSEDLAARFASAVVAKSNQEVVDRSHLIILCILPQQAEEVLRELRFHGNQSVVSVMAGVNLSVLQSLVAPATDIARSIPAAAVATRSGITPVYPATEAARDVYRRLGGYIEIHDEIAYESLSAASATVEAHCHYLNAVATWLSKQGIAAVDARRYVAAIFSELTEEMNTPDVDFGALASAHTTEGGLNEQFARHLAFKGTFTAINDGLDAVLARLTQHSKEEL
jgi:pyrroline-5-carboxylate reductase